MNQDDLNSLFSHAGELGASLRKAFREVTGEEPDLEAAIRHYPLVALGIAAGVGVAGGWWLSERSQNASDQRRGLSGRDRRELRLLTGETDPGESTQKWFDRWLPQTVDAVRRVVPDAVREEQLESARVWLETTLEPRLREGIDSAVDQVQKGRFGTYFKERLQGWGIEVEQQLDDPETPLEDRPL